jgi:hypothetical protein
MLSLRTFGEDITSKAADIRRLAAETSTESSAKPEATEDVVVGTDPAIGIAEDAGIIAEERVGETVKAEAVKEDA